MTSILKSRLAAIVLTVSVVFTVSVICGGVLAHGQSFAGSHAKVSLIAEEGAFQPGHTAWIGVLFEMEKGWHVYWVNPGDSGEPTKIQWQLPAGFHAGDIRWPVPVRLGTGTVIDYGYEGRVLLPMPLEVPANYNPATHATLAGDVHYLICREVCIPAKAHVALSAPAQAAAAPALFRDAREHSPKPMPANWKVQAADEGRRFVVDLETGSQEMKANFFPLDEDQIDNAAPQAVTPTPHGVKITLKKSDQLLKPIPTLRGVVVFGNNTASSSSPVTAFEISVPVTAARSANQHR